MKRFTATEKWSKEWFRALPAKLKCFWSYLCDNVDGAGVWDPDFGLASFQIGETITQRDVELIGDRLRTLPNGKIWIVGFIEFQCGELREGCNPHQKILQLLRKHGIFEEYVKSTRRVQEEDKDKEEDKEGGCKGEGTPTPPPPDWAPTIEQAVAAGKNQNIPEEVTRKWYDDRARFDWVTVKNGAKIQIKRWQYDLSSYWKSTLSNDAERKQRNGNHSKPSTESAANAGTANAGRASQY